MKINWLKHNLLIKTGALVLAVSLWFYVAGEEMVESEFKIPVQLVLASGMVVTEQSATGIDLGIRGRREVISKLAEGAVACRIDLTPHIKPQTLISPIEHKFISLPAEVKILKIIPERLTIKIDKLIQKIMPVRVVVFGEPAVGYKVEGFVIDPISSLIKGPEGYLKDMVYIDTEPVDVTGRQKSFKKMVPLMSIRMVGVKEQSQFVEVVVKIVESSKPKKS